MVSLNGTLYTEEFLILVGDICKDYRSKRFKEGQSRVYRKSVNNRNCANASAQLVNGDLFITGGTGDETK